MKLKPAIALILGLTLAGALNSLTLTNIEYFFDTDPGPGNGTQIYGRDTVELDQAIATAALAPGIHRLFVRARNDEGVWGLPHSARFFIPFAATTLEEGTVAAIEYFFDSDPGAGNGTQIYGRNTIELDQAIATATLTTGIHSLYVRSRDTDGVWGLPQSARFFIPFAATTLEEGAVAAIEYFFDSDPGTGNGTPVYGRNVVELDQLINTAALTTGIHRLHVRARDDEGKWGLPQSLAFLIPWAAVPGTEVTRLEYFLDADPGFGNGTQVILTPGASVNVSLPIPVGTVNHGNHYLYVHGRNSEGGWGIPACCQFSDGVPAQLTISVADGILTLSWEDLYGIDTYKVYSAPLPEGVYAEDAGGTFGPDSWTSPAGDPKRFYRVTSIYGE